MEHVLDRRRDPSVFPAMVAPQPHDGDRDIIFEQYKLYVTMADEISKRRAEANRFFTTLVGGGLAAVSVVLRSASLSELNYPLVIVVAVLGIVLSIYWRDLILTYRKLNRDKFKVIHEMETKLPYAPFDREWQIVRPNDQPVGRIRYRNLTQIEANVPVAVGLGYLALLTCVIVAWAR